jgi:hypothetical protein
VEETEAEEKTDLEGEVRRNGEGEKNSESHDAIWLSRLYPATAARQAICVSFANPTRSAPRGP